MGSVRQRKDDGRWFIQWIDGAGKQRQKTLSVRSPATAERKGHRLLADLERKAERQRLGLDPLPSELAGLTFGALLDHLWKHKGQNLRSPTLRCFLEKHLGPFRQLPAPEMTTARFDALLASKEQLLSAESLNKLRARASQMFSYASMAGGPWEGRPNPIAAVPRRKVIRRPHNVLRLEEVPNVLAEIPARLRPLYATALYTGMRKGELGGLRKADVDLGAGEIRVWRSWDAPRTKDGKAGLLPLVPALRPYLEAALRSPGEFVFPGRNGEMMRRDVALDRILRRALARAGVVIGYEHRCRRHGCGFHEPRNEAAAGACPRCDYQLYAKPIPRHVRFQDCRHTAATLLLKEGVPLAVVQKVLRHSDPKLTSEIYGHLELADMRRGLERLDFGPAVLPVTSVAIEAEPALLAANAEARTAPGLRRDELGKTKGRDSLNNINEITAQNWSGRLDLNQRPLAPQASALPGCATPRFESIAVMPPRYL